MPQAQVDRLPAAAGAAPVLAVRAALVDITNMNNHQQALITGGSSGIGLALGKALAREGYNVCLLARDQEKLKLGIQHVSRHIISEDQHIEALSCDVTNYDELSDTLKEWTRKRGVPDLVVNSAGVTYPDYFQNLELETFHWLMDVNYFGTLHVIYCLIPMMIERGSGTIVNICSQAGFVGVFGYSGYSASKYAVRGLSDVLRAEMKPHGIKIAIVFPPDTQTPQLEFEEPLKPEETKAIAGSTKTLTADQVADSILFGLKKNKYVILPGFEGKLFYRLVGLLGNLTYPIMDWMVRRAQKNK